MDLSKLSGTYRIEEDPQIPGSEEMTWPFEYKVEVTRDENDKDLYNVANDVSSGGEFMGDFIQIRDNRDGTYNLSFDEYGDGNFQSFDNIEEDVLMHHLNHLVNMDTAVKVSDLPAEETSETDETLEESKTDNKYVIDYCEEHKIAVKPLNESVKESYSEEESLKESVNLNKLKNIINVLNKNLGVWFKHSAGGVFFYDKTPFNTDIFNKLIENNYKSIGDALEEQGFKYDISEDAYISKDENLYVTVYGGPSSIIVQFEELKESNSNMGKVYIDSIYMGNDFNGDLTEEDITALTNEFALDEYPELKISGMTREPSGDWTLILEGPVDAINTWESDAEAKGIDYFIFLNESKLSDKVLDYIESTYDKAIAQNRANMAEGNGSVCPRSKNATFSNPVRNSETLEEGKRTNKDGYVLKVKNNRDGYNYEGCGGRSLVTIDSDNLSVFNTVEEAEKERQRYKDPSKVKIVELKKALTEDISVIDPNPDAKTGTSSDNLIKNIEDLSDKESSDNLIKPVKKDMPDEEEILTEDSDSRLLKRVKQLSKQGPVEGYSFNTGDGNTAVIFDDEGTLGLYILTQSAPDMIGTPEELVNYINSTFGLKESKGQRKRRRK